MNDIMKNSRRLFEEEESELPSGAVIVKKKFSWAVMIDNITIIDDISEAKCLAIFIASVKSFGFKIATNKKLEKLFALK